MSPTALALVLFAALAHALWNFAAKRVPENAVMFIWLTVVASAVLWVPIAAIYVAGKDLRPNWTWLWAGLVTAVLHILYSLVLQRGYAVGDLNVVYPLARGTGPLVTMVVAIVVLGERISTAAIIGGVVIVAGILVIVTGKSTGGSLSRRRSVVWGVATGLTIAAYTLWDDYAVNDLAIAPLAYFALCLLLEAILLAPGAWHYRKSASVMTHTYWREIAVVVVLSPLAYVLVLEAMRLASVALVAPARETSIVIGSLLAWLVLKEPHPARRLIGATVVLAGITALVLG